MQCNIMECNAMMSTLGRGQWIRWARKSRQCTGDEMKGNKHSVKRSLQMRYAHLFNCLGQEQVKRRGKNNNDSRSTFQHPGTNGVNSTSEFRFPPAPLLRLEETNQLLGKYWRDCMRVSEAKIITAKKKTGRSHSVSSA